MNLANTIDFMDVPDVNLKQGYNGDLTSKEAYC